MKYNKDQFNNFDMNSTSSVRISLYISIHAKLKSAIYLNCNLQFIPPKYAEQIIMLLIIQTFNVLFDSRLCESRIHVAYLQVVQLGREQYVAGAQRWEVCDRSLVGK